MSMSRRSKKPVVEQRRCRAFDSVVLEGIFMKKVVSTGMRSLGELTDHQIDILVCMYLGQEVWPCGILQILDAVQKQGRHVQMRFALALRLSLVDQTVSTSALIQLQRVLFGMTAKHCKEAALRAIGVVDSDGYLVEKPLAGDAGDGRIS